MDEKYCKWCKQTKSIDSFYKDSTRSTGFKEKCKECMKKRKEYLKQHNENILTKKEKKCSMCKQIKLVEFFGKNKSANDGLTTYCSDCTREYNRRKEHYKSYGKNWYEANKISINKSRQIKRVNGGKIKDQERQQKLKLEVMQAYGCKCVCCGVDILGLLTIDHIYNDGKEHREEIGSNLYRWLKQNNFPKDRFQILCGSCNFAKSQCGECPHQKHFREEILTNENLY